MRKSYFPALSCHVLSKRKQKDFEITYWKRPMSAGASAVTAKHTVIYYFCVYNILIPCQVNNCFQWFSLQHRAALTSLFLIYFIYRSKTSTQIECNITLQRFKSLSHYSCITHFSQGVVIEWKLKSRFICRCFPSHVEGLFHVRFAFKLEPLSLLFEKSKCHVMKLIKWKCWSIQIHSDTRYIDAWKF